MHTINSIAPHSNEYTALLATIDPAPTELHYCGTLPDKRLPSVAIVGTRKPTSYGREVTTTIATDLAQYGVVIVSGLAIGVDSIAHQAALDAGGITLAVQANGLHRVYPAAHRRLANTIIESGGALLSEYPSGVEPLKHRFLERNRIVSGLADVVIITEAAARSGTLNTAAHALSQGKDVFVVPGNITSPMSAGCNQLLRQGAMPLLDTNDVYESLGIDTKKQLQTTAAQLTPLEQKIVTLIQQGVRDGDDIATQLNCTASEFNTALTMLELKDVIRSLGANRWAVA